MTQVQLGLLISVICFLIIGWRFWYLVTKGMFTKRPMPPQVTPGQYFNPSVAVLDKTIYTATGQKPKVYTGTRKALLRDALPYMTVSELIDVRDGKLTKQQLDELFEMAINRNIKYR